MTMKHLLRYASTTLLRTVLLFGVLSFVNTPAEAQTAEQWALMPDAFETMDPATIIGDGQYYYIQFYQRTHDKCSYLTDCGVNKRARVKDFLPYANNRLWTLVAAGDGVENHFKLKNKDGHYISFGSFESANRFGCVDNIAAATILTFHALDEGYDISEASDEGNPMYRPSYNEWTDLAKVKKYSNSQSYNLDLFRLRFAKLKSSAAFIIYYRGEGPDNSNPNATTTRHYLTYSGTGNQVAGSGTLQNSDVSSRLSVYRSDEPLSKLPTLATYHEDGLWTLEPSGDNGDFLIKKYGANDYLLNSGNNIGVLGAKDAINASYRVEDNTVNRYTPIVKVNYTETALTKDMFKEWNGDGSGATVTNNSPAVDFNVGNGVQIGQNAMVAGTSNVNHLIYADLSEYSKMVINGTQDMQLRVLLSRQESNSGPMVEKNVTIGSDGKAIVDLKNLALNYSFAKQTAAAAVKMTYVSGSDGSSFTDNNGNPFTIDNNVNTSYGEVTTAVGGYNNINDNTVVLGNKSWAVNNIIYLQVDASAINGTISKVTLNAQVSGSTDGKRTTTWGVGYNDSQWSSNLTWNTADRSITTLGDTQSTTTNSASVFEDKSFDITGAFNSNDKIVTILVYETAAAGGNFRNPTVEVEYTPNSSDVNINFAHLNAIKTGNGSATGTISSITLLKEVSSGNRYLHYSKGDGWQVEHWTGKHTDPYELWDAAFLPVEVPDPKEDEYYQVLLKVKNDNPTKIKLTGATKNPTITPLSGSTLDNLYGATFTPTADLTNVFKIENMPTGCYEKIVINFGSAVPSGWYYHAYGPQGDYYSLEGKTQLEITLDPERTIDDFTIFNWFDVRSSITINEVYFTPDSPSCTLEQMLNHHGGTDAYSELPGQRKLWHLEQDDDYQHFRLKAPNGQYFQADGTMTTDRNSAKVFTNTELLAKYDLKWFYFSAAKETYVDYMVTHRISYLKQYSDLHSDLELDKQGLNTEVQSDWWNYDRGTQKVNHFEITHYIKRDNTITVEFPTVLNKSNDHRFFQRFYNYDEDKAGDVMDLDNLKAHVNLDTGDDDGDVQYFLYRNGMVTGQKLDWEGINASGMRRDVLRRFNFTNSDGKPFTVGVDVSRYDDKTYKNSSNHLEGDLEEPSLTMRYVYYMNDAKEMAAKLTAKTFKGLNFVDTKEGENFLEAKTFHFPQRQIFYEKQKKVGYRGEFIGLRHVFSDYWVFNDRNPNSTDDNNLVSAVNNNQGGKIEVKIYDPNGTGIRLGGWNPKLAAANSGNLKFVDNVDTYDADTEADFQGFYFYDKMSDQNKTQYGDSRFVVFRYPAPGDDGIAKVPDEACGKPVYINVYLNNDGTRYQLAQFTVIFDPGTVTLPYKSVNGSDYVAKDGTEHAFADRGPKKLIEKAGLPIAKVTFDYPANEKYHFPTNAVSIQGWERDAGSTIDDCGPIPMTFDKTNYSFSGFECNWGSYAIVTKMTTNYGNNIEALPANDNVYGYGYLLPGDEADQQMSAALQADEGLQKGFLYIDASEQPGDICSAPFVGDFCAGDKLMFSGWISGSNKMGGADNRCPGGITLTVKGERNVHDENGAIVYENGHPKKETMTLYRFCPGQIYELDNGTGADGSTGADHVVWQQFYFEFVVGDKYDRHWIEVNNNCVSSQGGDFMLDNVAVYATVPEVLADVNTPICVSVNDEGEPVTEMRLMKLSVDYNKLRSSTGVNDISTAKSEMGFVFLDKEVFLKKFRTGLQALTDAEKHVLHLDGLDFSTITLDQLSDAIEDGELKEVNEKEIVEPGQPGYAEYMAYYKAFEVAYKEAFDEALIGEKTVWHSNYPTENMHGAVLYFEWSHRFEDMEPYTFEKAVNKTHAVYREVVDGERFLVMNGNFPELNWKAGTDYYIITSNKEIKEHRPWVPFNICSECTKVSVFRIKPPYELLGLEKSENSEDYMVCEGQIPTLVTNLKGYDLEGNEVPMNDINYDWWLGDKANGVLPTLAAYHAQEKDGVRLDRALATLRIYYPELTSLDGITGHAAEGGNPALTPAMVSYLKELVDAGQLVLHQKSISIPAEPAAADDPYFYLVACPIHDGYFDKALNPAANEYVAYFCDEPQGLRVKIGQKAPTLKTGFVPNQNGFTAYNYPADDPILSIRLAKRAQFMTVQHGESTETPVANPATAANDLHFLWLPVRDAQTQTADGVIRKSDDYNIYLASTNDPVWDKNIYTSMKSGALPVVGKIVSLYAKNTYSEDADAAAALIAGQNAVNRLCVYFTENFEVREGYTYTLSLPFQEEGDVNTCDGTMLINLKIVPDYEVWTGGADNTDWNNDQNWRRADGNTAMPTTEPTDESKRNNNELLVSNTLPEESGLYQYKTNYWNYRTAKDRLLRKGFAPLYCTHILMKANEWGDAPVLYDALDGKANLEAYPFPNLRDKDGWDGTVTDEVEGTTATTATTTAILKFDMQARLYDIWSDTYGSNPDRGRSGDLIAEMYQINSCDEIAFQPSAELLNAHLLNYNNAWVEYQLDNKRWYLLGSPLQGTISGEWYAPTGTAQQKTTYYEPVTFGEGYDRYSPAIYQRSWDKAKAVLYEVGSTYSIDDDDQGEYMEVTVESGQNPSKLGYYKLVGQEYVLATEEEPSADTVYYKKIYTENEGEWNNSGNWQTPTGGADQYLDRLGYKPMDGKKANVAIKGVWSNTYNDATVDYTKGGFSVMVMNHLKGSDGSDGTSIIRLPKEDTMYDYYEFAQTGAADGGTDTYLSDPNGQDKDDVQTNLRRALNRGRLKTDLLLPTSNTSLPVYQQIQRQETAASRYGDKRTYTRVPTQVNADYGLPIANKLLPISETVVQGVSNLGYYLVENPFPCGLDMEKFFEENTGLEEKYWLLTATGQHLVQRAATGEWIAQTGEPAAFAATTAKVAPGQGFFVQAKDPSPLTTHPSPLNVTFTADMQAQTRYGEPDDGTDYTIVVGTKQKMTTKLVTYDHDDNPETPEVPLMVDDDNDPNTPDVQATVEVPVVNEQTGEYEVEDIKETVTIYTYKQKTGDGFVFPLKARRTRSDEYRPTPGLVVTAQRGSNTSCALVMMSAEASDDFLPSEDTETFISMDELKQVPMVYTLCGRLATTINSIHDFTCLPLGVESNSEAPCTLTFQGVEQLGDSVAFYDAVERKLTPLESGMKFTVSGQTQNRYYIVSSLNEEEVAEETHLQIFTEGRTAKVIASTAEPITDVRCFDAAGRLVHSASPQTMEYSFTLPDDGIYIIEAKTEKDRKTKKVAVK